MHSMQYNRVHIFIEQKKILWYNFYDNRVAGWYGLHTKRRWCQWNNLISKTLWPLVCLSLHCWPSCVCCVNNYFSKRKSTPKLWPVNGWSFFHICRPTHLVGGCPFSFLVYHHSHFCATTKSNLRIEKPPRNFDRAIGWNFHLYQSGNPPCGRLSLFIYNIPQFTLLCNNKNVLQRYSKACY